MKQSFQLKFMKHFYSIKNDIDIKRETLLLSLNMDKEEKDNDEERETFRKNFQIKINLFIHDA
jgi:hypothetical protein